jgi:RNA polymerase sigma-70 factor (ECF subfamily)
VTGPREPPSEIDAAREIFEGAPAKSGAMVLTAPVVRDLAAPPPPRAAAGTVDPSLTDAFRAARPVVRAVCAKILRCSIDQPDVDDCVAETWKRALESRGQLIPGAPIGPWLTGIARHVAIDRGRARRRDTARHGGSSSDEALADAHDLAPSPESLVAQRATHARLQTVLAGLHAGQRRALLAFHVEGKPYAEIGRELGVPIGTVATWVARGRSEIARLVRDEETQR